MSEQDDRLWQSFEDDIERSLDQAETGLLELEENRTDSEGINSVYRALHTIKGSSRFFSLVSIDKVAHAAEDLMGMARDEGLELSDEAFDALLTTVDLLKVLLTEVLSTRQDVQSDQVPIMCETLRALGKAAPEPPEKDDDLTVFLFDDDEPEEPAAKVADEPKPSKAVAKVAKKPTKDVAIKVRKGKIQSLLSLANEIALAANEVLHDERVAAVEDEEFLQKTGRVQRLLRELRFSTAGLALVPVGDLFDRIRRGLRELKRETSKEINLVLEGEETEIDKTMVDGLADPLVHLLRNAVDHGLEMPEEREAAGKSRTGNVGLTAYQEGDEIVVSVWDDGRGLNRERLLAKALERGQVTADMQLSDEEVWQLALLPGLSTKTEVTSLSGRGVGMDVVKRSVEDLRGRLSIKSQRDKGTRIEIRLPLTLAFADGLVFQVQDSKYFVPVLAINQILHPGQYESKWPAASPVEYLQVEDKHVPVLWLEELFGAERSQVVASQKATLICETRAGPLAIPVDEFRGTHQVTIRPLRGFLKNIRVASACGLLPTGEVVLGLDLDRLASLRFEGSLA